MKTNWNRIVVVVIIVAAVLALTHMTTALTHMTTALAARGDGGAQSGSGFSRGSAGRQVQPGGGVQAPHAPMTRQGGGQGLSGPRQKPGGMGQGQWQGTGQRDFNSGGRGFPGQGDRGFGRDGGRGDRRSFDRNRFDGHDHDWWRHNHQHHYWNGNRWVYGVEPAGFVYVPVPAQYCPFTANSFRGDSYGCYQTCVNNGYDPLVCENCCGVV